MVKKDFQNYFPTKSYSSVSQNIKMRNGLIAQKAKVLSCPNFALLLDFLSVTVWAKKNWKYCFDPKLHVGFCYKIWNPKCDCMSKKKIENIVSIQSYT